MKKCLKKSFGLIMSIFVILTLLPLSLIANAETSGIFTYKISNDEVTITDCDTSASGSIVIPSTIDGYKVTAIGSNTFSDCVSVSSVTIPDGVASIGSRVFNNCQQLESIVVDSNNENFSSDSDGVLYSKDGSTLIQYPIGNTRTTYTVSDNVSEIGSYAFEGSANLTEILLPESLLKINNGAFMNCVNIESIFIPSQVESIGCKVFSLGVKYVFVDGSNKNYSSDDEGVLYDRYKTIIIQCPGNNARTSYSINANVRIVSSYAFDECCNLKSVFIPDKVMEIGSYAFYNCIELTDISIPDSVTTIGYSAFRYCRSLTSIAIPDKVHEIGSSTFEGCSSMKEVVIGNGVQNINNDAFKGCSSIENLTIPCSVNIKSQFTFNGCNKIKRLNLTKGTGYFRSFNKAFIDYRPWRHSKSTLEEVTLEEGIENISTKAFSGCSALKKVTISDTIFEIGSSAFSNCQALNEVNISSLSSWYGIIFQNNQSNPLYYSHNLYLNNELVTSLSIPEDVTCINDYAFYGCQSIENITIPDTVTKIGKNTFYLTGYYNNAENWDDGVLYIDNHLISTKTSLGDVCLIKDGTKTIARGAFQNKTDLTYAVIPDSLNYINSYAFDGCTGLTTAIIPDSVSDIDSTSFGNCSDALTIYGYENSYVQQYCLDNSYNFSVYSADITFDSVGGNIGKVTETVYTIKPLKDAVTPTKDDMYFAGWYDLPNYGNELDENTIITGNTYNTVYAHWIKSISINQYPEKTDYYMGEAIDASGMKLTVLYDNGDFETIDSGFEVENSEADSVGNQLVSVNYKGAAAAYTVSVSAVEPETLSVKSVPDKTSYFVGDELDLTGLSLLLEYNNGDIETITDGYTAENVNMNTAGYKTVKVSYNGLSASFVINVTDIVPVSAEVTSLPDKLSYFVGDSLDTGGLALRVTYNNGYSETVTDGFACSPDVLSKSGTQSVGVEYSGITTSFDVTVQKVIPTELIIKNLPKKTKYYVGDTLKTKGLYLSLKYNNSTEKALLDLSAVNFVYDFGSIGEQTVTFSYTENGVTLTSSFSVDVVKTELLYPESDICVDSGNVVGIPIYILNNNGVSGFKISISYDKDIFTPVSVSGGSLLGLSDSSSDFSMLESNADSNPNGTLDVIWTSTDDITENGLIFTAYFEVNPSASGEYQMNISYDSDNSFDCVGNPVKFKCTDAVISVNHIDLPTSPTLKIESVIANPGDTISIPVTAYNISATEELEVNIIYDKDIFNFVSVESSMQDLCEYKIRANGVRVTISSLDAVSNATLFVLNLKVSDNAYGDYTFEMTAENAEISEEITTEPAKVSIISTVSVYGSNIQVEPGTNAIDLPIYIKNNHGIMGYGLYIDYDTSILSVESVTRGSAMSEGNFDFNVIDDGRLLISWVNSRDFADNGELFIVHFSVNTDNPAKTDINISYDVENTFDENWDNVELFCEDVSVSILPDEIIFAKQDSTAIVKNGYIYGLQPGLKSLDDFIEVADGFTVSYLKTIGTKTVVEAKLNGETVKTYTVIIFGDVNGDGWYDGMDALIASCIVNGLMTKEQIGEAAYMAADCNHDGVIDKLDVDMLNQAGVLLVNVDQTQNEEFLQTSSSYVEYMNLINQQADNTQEEIPEDGSETHNNNIWGFLIKLILDLIDRIFAIVKLY